jgi:hypothetical protein
VNVFKSEKAAKLKNGGNTNGSAGWCRAGFCMPAFGSIPAASSCLQSAVCCLLSTVYCYFFAVYRLSSAGGRAFFVSLPLVHFQPPPPSPSLYFTPSFLLHARRAWVATRAGASHPISYIRTAFSNTY